MRTTTVSNEVLLPEVAKLLDEGRKVTIKAKGNSMLPFMVGHRIIKIDGEKVILMGDGNLIVQSKIFADKQLQLSVTAGNEK